MYPRCSFWPAYWRKVRRDVENVTLLRSGKLNFRGLLGFPREFVLDCSTAR
jgi:hypothetical protein